MRPGILAALCRIAFLPSASSAMAIRLTGDARAGEWLEDLARRSLFTDRRDGPTPRYTFHALYGECLRSRAAAELTPAAMQALYHDAAVVLADNGQHEDAVALLLTAQAWVDALAAMPALAESLVAEGRTDPLASWLQALPVTLRDTPAPRYWLGVSVLVVDPPAALQHLEWAHRGYVLAGDVAGAFESARAAADAIIFVGASYDALAPWMPLLERHAGVYLAQPDRSADLRILPGLLAAFDNILHRLRKLLGAERHRVLQGGALSLNTSSCWTDLAALEGSRAEAEVLARSPPCPVAQAGALVDRVLTLYQGAFLAGEDGVPEVLAARKPVRPSGNAGSRCRCCSGCGPRQRRKRWSADCGISKPSLGRSDLVSATGQGAVVTPCAFNPGDPSCSSHSAR
ncbi:MAG: hypothetical protein KA387_05805 [Rubrivivax sp.]|nr:hypothetical protein [Rubrivivax sp.]